MPDAHFADPRLVALYDRFDPDRRDLDAYAAMVDEFAARSVLDVGCGTGTFACLLAARGIDVIGVDPAESSLALARTKTGAERVRWIYGDVTTLPPLAVDLAVMTGNVAQVFTDDAALHETLAGIHAALRPGGRLVFETRNPAAEAWRRWTRERTFQRLETEDAGTVERWVDLQEVRGPFVSFRTSFRFLATGEVLESFSTLRFRERGQVAAALDATGFTVAEVRGAPDRPGLEFVFIAEKR